MLTRKRPPVRFILWVPMLIGLTVSGLILFCPISRAFQPSPDPSKILVTAYCSCGDCCNWRPRYWFFGDPIIASGPRKGSPKIVGQTASGRLASKGTVAADPKVYPFGTQLDIPGYGIGRVEDVGGAIKGRHIDVWFPSHTAARRWGARWLEVRELR